MPAPYTSQLTCSSTRPEPSRGNLGNHSRPVGAGLNCTKPKTHSRQHRRWYRAALVHCTCQRGLPWKSLLAVVLPTDQKENGLLGRFQPLPPGALRVIFFGDPSGTSRNHEDNNAVVTDGRHSRSCVPYLPVSFVVYHPNGAPSLFRSVGTIGTDGAGFFKSSPVFPLSGQHIHTSPARRRRQLSEAA